MKIIKIVSFHKYADEPQSTVIMCLPRHEGDNFVTQKEALQAATDQSATQGPKISKWSVFNSNGCICMRESKYYRDTHVHVSLKGIPDE